MVKANSIPSHLSDSQKRTIFYTIFDALKDLPLRIDTKRRMMEEGFYREGIPTWVIDGITIDALVQLQANSWSFRPTVDGKLQKANVVRGHGHGRLDRIERAQELFQGSVAHEDAFDFWFYHDRSTLCTQSENGSKGTGGWSDVIPLDEDLFGHVKGFAPYLTKARTEVLGGILTKWLNAGKS